MRAGRAARFISGHNRPRLQERVATPPCLHCGAVLMLRPALADRKFCSAACRDAYPSQHAGAEHPTYRRVTAECEICGTAFAIQPGRLKAGRRYCSNECGQRAKVLHLTGVVKAPGCWHVGRELALKRDGHACRLCGFADALNVHHIVPRAEGGTHEVANLITLCPNHHALAHLGKLSASDLARALRSPLHDRAA